MVMHHSSIIKLICSGKKGLNHPFRKPLKFSCANAPSSSPSCATYRSSSLQDARLIRNKEEMIIGLHTHCRFVAPASRLALSAKKRRNNEPLKMEMRSGSQRHKLMKQKGRR